MAQRETMIERHIRKVIDLIDVASIAKKIVLALLGLFLITFLLVHLGLNLTVLRNDGGEWFRAAAYFMGSNWIVRILGFGILLAILAHIALAGFIKFMNWRARPVGYKAKTKSKAAFGSRFMMWTGLAILGFLVIHLTHFWFVKMGWNEGHYVVKTELVERALGARQLELSTAYMNTQDEDEMLQLEMEFMALERFVQSNEKLQVLMFPARGGERFIIDLSREDITELTAFLGNVPYKADFYTMMHDMFRMWWMVLLYVLAMIPLGMHLAHAIPSGLQTLGLAHSKYTFIIKIIGYVTGALIAFGFALVPLWIFIFR